MGNLQNVQLDTPVKPTGSQGAGFQNKMSASASQGSLDDRDQIIELERVDEVTVPSTNNQNFIKPAALN